MATGTARREIPASAEDAAALLREAAEAGRSVRIVGGETKAWGHPGREPELELHSSGLDRIVEHNAGDLTAVLEPGVRLADAQDRFAEAGQMLALDPPDGGATIGGVVAAGDSGPLRSRYGGARDLVVGVRAALPDGTVVRAGGKVIKNVAGYDLAKLLTGSFGTLGVIVELAVRLHPRPPATATAVGRSDDGPSLARAAVDAAHAPLEAEALDVSWGPGGGAVLVRFGGVAPLPAAEAAGRLLAGAGLDVELADDDAAIWDAQRAAQRSSEGTVVRVSSTQSRLPAVIAAAERLGATLVGRAGLGLSWLRLEERSAGDSAAAAEELRARLAPDPCVVLDAPADVRGRVDPWGPVDPGLLAVMRRLKQRFDPDGVCNPGVFVGGI
ncbi:MAG: FAD-binding oxidoreductase [Thermoleophilaceae bacterium]